MQVHLVSQHANLKAIAVTRHGRMAVPHFKYTTEDACGQNMVTGVTSHLCQWILSKIKEELPQVKVLFYSIESTLSGDKNMTFTNLWRTRGFHVQAEAWIPEDILKSVLKACMCCVCMYVCTVCMCVCACMRTYVHAHTYICVCKCIMCM